MKQRPTSSSALAVNLELTRVQVEIPEHYQILLTTVQDYLGIHNELENFLKEYFHPMRNINLLANAIRNVASPMAFGYYDRQASYQECTALFSKIFQSLYQTKMGGETLHKIFWAHLNFVVTLSESVHCSSYFDVISQNLSFIISIMKKNSSQLFSCCNFVRNAGKRFSSHPKLGDKFTQVYKACVEEGLKIYKNKIDFRGFFAKRHPEALWQYENLSNRVGKDVLAERLIHVEALSSPEEILAEGNLDDLINQTIKELDAIADPVHCTELYAYFSSVEQLHYRDMDIQRGLQNAFQRVCEQCNDDNMLHAFDLVTSYLLESGFGQSDVFFTCLKILAKVIGQKKNVKLTEHYVTRVIGFGFVNPDITGVSEQWEVIRNTQHLECVRTWLHIIEENPVAFEHLLSALIINLYFRKVFLSDTDLFQRDITRLLNTISVRSFSLTLQLVSLFPIFFHDIGSEGDLREVSTEIDSLTLRKDPVIHFLRKQSHAESHNRLVQFARAVLAYWETGDAKLIESYLPQSVFDSLQMDAPYLVRMRDLLKQLMASDDINMEALANTHTLHSIEDILARNDLGSDEDKRRFFLMIRFYRLLQQKYEFLPDQLFLMLEHSSLIDREIRNRFIRAHQSQNAWKILCAGNQLLLALKENIIDSKITEPDENIYHKRHIAAGIPSMYGSYHEIKFDSLGLFLRLKTYLQTHLEQIIQNYNYRYITRRSMLEAYDIMQQMLLGLKASGLSIEDLSSKVELLNRSISEGNFSVGQYLNLFEFIENAVQDLIQTHFITIHSSNLKRITRQILEEQNRPAHKQEENTNAMAESFLRNMVAQIYGLQAFDTFLTRILDSLRTTTKNLDEQSCFIVLNYHPDQLISFMDGPLMQHEDQLHLGYKGYALKKLHALNMPVPPGFIISSELFDIMPALSYSELRKDTRERILSALRWLEKLSGLKLGDPQQPLLLSVRSGAAISMPGMLDTIINVGMNDDLVEAMSQNNNSGWTSWDCYRRLIQSYAMSCGVDRNVFDDIMIHFKDKYQVRRKVEFTSEQLREMAYEYKSIAQKNGISLIEDPVDQLIKTIFLVLRSWNSESAKVYRQQMQLAEAWGTAVIVQQMVLGNLESHSGTGVVFTRDPRGSAASRGLFGDYVECSQGEDVVAGLVNPYPISEKQRVRYFPDQTISLEKTHPFIYSRLKEISDTLLTEHGYDHQEMEFTFESKKSDGLFILQTKPMFPGGNDEVTLFADPKKIEAHLIGRGVGVNGGALSGRVVFSRQDIRQCQENHPNDPVILLRPDTVPEDIALVLESTGVLTSRGGVTSHASVTTKRIGKTCVVNCQSMKVFENEHYAQFNGHQFQAGDWLSIDGHSGCVYSGKHATTEAHKGFTLF